jgi:HEAT repeat protein
LSQASDIKDDAMNDLIGQLSDPGDTVRVCAAYNLGMIGDAGAVPALLILLKSRKSLDRRAAALALGKIGTQEALAALRNAANDRDAVVRGFAVEAVGTRMAA